MRKNIVAGNWKMNTTVEDSVALANSIASLIKEKGTGGTEVVICPPFVNIASALSQTEGSEVHVGAQNCYTKESGAYTGEISVGMLKAMGVSHVILGHSERREYFGEDNAFLAEKVKVVLAAGLTPIFCCGETLSQREEGMHFDFVKSQLTESLFDLSEADFGKVVIAYEPIWAIGTGVTATSAQAQEMHKVLRDHVASKYGQTVADDTSLLYGGSAKPANAGELFACPDVDGGLIGGASLKAEDFVAIIHSF